MRTHLECVACLVRQAVEITRKNVPFPDQEAFLKGLLECIARFDYTSPPPLMAMEMYDRLREHAGIEDPYAEAKRVYTEKALSCSQRLTELITRSENPLDTAMRVAIAGNIIDFGAGIPELISIEETVQTSLSTPFAIDHSQELKDRISRGGDVLYLADNAGEIVFDRLFIEQIGPDRVTCAVRDIPIINDATISDADHAGVSRICTVISSGSRAPGTPRQMWTEEFRKRFQAFDVVISKGQGNFETLTHPQRDVFFLFMVKCSIIAREVGAPLHSFIVMKRSG